jgi:3-deoxy-manno-octulosonate cytidylyltransferase (CMP-KDO synthetase)
MTAPIISGTDRVAEIAPADTAEWIVNVCRATGRSIDPGAIDAAILPLLDEPSIPMGTLKKRIEDPHEVGDPNVVKVVTDRFENAIYFSRSTIPYPRDQAAGQAPSPVMGKSQVHFKHIGLYVYRRDFLLRYPYIPVGPI